MGQFHRLPGETGRSPQKFRRQTFSSCAAAAIAAGTTATKPPQLVGRPPLSTATRQGSRRSTRVLARLPDGPRTPPAGRRASASRRRRGRVRRQAAAPPGPSRRGCADSAGRLLADRDLVALDDVGRHTLLSSAVMRQYPDDVALSHDSAVLKLEGPSYGLRSRQGAHLPPRLPHRPSQRRRRGASQGRRPPARHHSHRRLLGTVTGADDHRRDPHPRLRGRGCGGGRLPASRPDDQGRAVAALRSHADVARSARRAHGDRLRRRSQRVCGREPGSPALPQARPTAAGAAVRGTADQRLGGRPHGLGVAKVSGPRRVRRQGEVLALARVRASRSPTPCSARSAARTSCASSRVGSSSGWCGPTCSASRRPPAACCRRSRWPPDQDRGAESVVEAQKFQRPTSGFTGWPVKPDRPGPASGAVDRLGVGASASSSRRAGPTSAAAQRLPSSRAGPCAQPVSTVIVLPSISITRPVTSPASSEASQATIGELSSGSAIGRGVEGALGHPGPRDRARSR